jgi:hypothetical protein
MGVDLSILDPPREGILDVLYRTLEVLLKLVFGLGDDRGSER